MPASGSEQLVVKIMLYICAESNSPVVKKPSPLKLILVISIYAVTYRTGHKVRLRQTAKMKGEQCETKD